MASQEHRSIPNHQPLDCLSNSLLRLAWKKTSKIHVTGPLWVKRAESIGDRWIPRTKGQQRGKLFHAMTSSWHSQTHSYQLHSRHRLYRHDKGCQWFSLSNIVNHCLFTGGFARSSLQFRKLLYNRIFKIIDSQTVPSFCCQQHFSDVTMGAIASQITSITIVYSTVYSDADRRKHQSSAPLAFVRGIHRGPVNSSHKWPVTRKMFPFDDVIMNVPARGLPSLDVGHRQVPARTLKSLRWRTVAKHQRLDCLHNRLFRRRSKKTLKLRVTGLCEGNPPVTGGFPSQRAQ